MGVEPLKGVLEEIMPSYITLSKIGIGHNRIAFPRTLCTRIGTGIEQSHIWGAHLNTVVILRTSSYAHRLG